MTFLVLPLKRSTNIDVTKSLKSVLKPTSSLSGDGIDSLLKDFQGLRVKALKVHSTGGDPTLDSVSRYYDQLASLEGKIPISELQIPFKYKDAFDKGSLFGGRVALTVSSLLYEKVGMLFNLAVLQANSAAGEALNSEGGLQSALKKMQTAGGIFQYLKENAVALIQQEPTPDLEQEALGVLSDLMLAQSQEVVVLKAIHGNMKSTTLSKLCKQCDEFYATALGNMQKDSVKHLWESNWVSHVGAKQAFYVGLSHYYLGKVAVDDMKIGPAIARFQHAEALLKAAQERANSIGGEFASKVKSFLQRAQHELGEVKKDNDFIYHERVPELSALEAPAKVAVAKLVPFAYDTRYCPGERDLFEELMPVQIQHAMNTFESRKGDKSNQEICKLKSATELLNDLLASMNFPAAIEETSGNSLPESLVKKSKDVVEAGGLDAIEGKMKELPSLVQRNLEILQECDRMIQEEESTDNQLRERFKEKWTRTPSSSLANSLCTNSQKYHELIKNASQADELIKSRHSSHKEGIELLSKGPDALKSLVPASNTPSYPPNSLQVIELRSLMKEVASLKEERTQLETSVKSPIIDMKAVFQSAFSQKGSIDEMNISSSALNEAFGPLEKRVADNLSKQERLISDIQKNYDLLISQSGGGQGGQGTHRDDLLKKLAAAHDGFFDLMSNLKEGNEFYSGMTNVLVLFQNKVSDFCFARKTEKEELLKDLTSGIANMSVSDDIKIPLHHTQGTPDRPPRKVDTAPPRPPPPATQAATAPAPPNPYAGAPGPMPQLPYPTQPGSAGMPFIPMPYYMPQMPPQGYYPPGAYPTAAYPPNYLNQPYPYPPPPPNQ